MPPPVDIFLNRGGKCRTAREREREVAALAASQHGVIAARQLLELGVDRRAIDHRLSTGRLHRLHAGIYAVGHTAVTLRGRWLAAVLAGGAGALLSHRDAAHLWGIRSGSRAAIDVLTPRPRRGRPGITFHSGRIDPTDVAEEEDIPVTSLARTLVDLGAVVSPQSVAGAFDEAQRLELVDVRAIAATLDRHSNRRGAGRLRELIGVPLPGVMQTRSPLERRFLRLCLDFALPMPAVNSVVAGYEVDAVWGDQKLAVELDGEAYHRGSRAAERDTQREAHLARAGYRVVRLKWHEVVYGREVVGARIRQLLAAGRHFPQ